MRDLLASLSTLDRRVIFLVVFLSVALPLLFPVGLPIQVSKEVRTLFEAVDELPEGSIVYLAADFDPGSMPELYPMLEAGLRHMFRKNIRIVAASLWPAAPPLVEKAWREIGEEEFGKVYGVDFVNLGFKEGREVVMVSVGENLPSTYPEDYRGTPVSELPVMEGLESLKDFALMFNVSAGYPGTKEWVQQVQSRFDILIGAGVTAVSAPEYYPYVQAKQLVGLLGGLAGAAEYEQLVDVAGSATKGMDAQSLGHIVIVLFILVGNAVHLARRREADRV